MRLNLLRLETSHSPTQVLCWVTFLFQVLLCNTNSQENCSAEGLIRVTFRGQDWAHRYIFLHVQPPSLCHSVCHTLSSRSLSFSSLLSFLLSLSFFLSFLATYLYFSRPPLPLPFFPLSVWLIPYILLILLLSFFRLFSILFFIFYLSLYLFINLFI